MTVGNVFMGTHQFSYDNGGDANTFVGVLAPLGNAAYLVKDGGLKIRATALRAGGG